MIDLEEHDEGRAVRREMEPRNQGVNHDCLCLREHGEGLQGCRKRECK